MNGKVKVLHPEHVWVKKSRSGRSGADVIRYLVPIGNIVIVINHYQVSLVMFILLLL